MSSIPSRSSELPSPPTRGWFGRAGAATLALIGGCGLVLAAGMEPFGVWLPLLMTIFAIAAQWRWPHGWLFYLPALLPVVDLVPFTGNMLLTEADQLLLLAALTGYGRLAVLAPGALPGRRGAHISLLGGGLVALLALSYAIGVARGFLPYAPMEEQLAGYHSRWNALRVGKGFFLPLLLLPLLVRALREEGSAAVDRLAYGAVAGLGGVCLFALWERLAYPGFLNFSSDYRITASFWEMSVGGAALDGWLALTLPFSVWAAMRSRGLTGLVLLMTLAGLAVYVALVTFSRGVYAACVVGALVWALTWARAAVRRSPDGEDGARGGGMSSVDMLTGALLLGILSWGMWTVFPTGGYRVLAAIMILVPAAHLVASAGHRARSGALVVAGLVFAVVAAGEMALFLFVEKGAYLAFGMAASLFAWAALSWMKRRTSATIGSLIGLWVAMAMGAALVALHWGDTPALADCLRTVAAMALLLLVLCLRAEPVRAWQPKFGLVGFGIAAVVSLVVAVPGSYYMGSRFSTSQQDLAGREKHWTAGMSWLDSTADWFLGKGVGRFPETDYWRAAKSERPGVYAFPAEGESRFMRLVSAEHHLAWDNLWRLMQPLPRDAAGPLEVSLDVRTAQDVALDFESCNRHLIYAQDCVGKVMVVKADAGRWQTMRVKISAMPADSSPWYAPKIAWFALALETSKAKVDLDNVRVLDASGRGILRNGDFSAGGDFWFFSSDRDHLPWHIKNMFLNMVFDQGLLGLLAFGLLLLGASLRVLARAGEWPLAPFFLASMAGFVAVGLFDSLVDVPRLATLYYLMCFTMLVVRPGHLVRADGKPHAGALRRGSASPRQ